MTNETIAMILSIIGMIINIIAFQMKTQKKFIIVQSISSGVFMTTYFFAFAWIGMILNSINVIRNVLYLIFKGDEKKNKIMIIISTVLIIISYFAIVFYFDKSANKLFSVLPIVGTVLGTISLFLKNVATFRILKISEEAGWLGYNLCFGLTVIGAIIAGIFAIISGIVALIRYGKIKPKK